jgi:hypothetical protein
MHELGFQFIAIHNTLAPRTIWQTATGLPLSQNTTRPSFLIYCGGLSGSIGIFE